MAIRPWFLFLKKIRLKWLAWHYQGLFFEEGGAVVKDGGVSLLLGLG
jgi:hypothetical protein